MKILELSARVFSLLVELTKMKIVRVTALIFGLLVMLLLMAALGIHLSHGDKFA